MDAIFRSLAVYLFLLVTFRVIGKRSLAQITTFDFVLLLIIGESTQQALLGDDFSVFNCFIVVATLVGTELALTWIKRRSPRMDKWIESVPLVIVENGKPLKERMQNARIDEEDVLTSARELQGLERMEQIKYAVLERSGGISIIPR